MCLRMYKTHMSFTLSKIKLRTRNACSPALEQRWEAYGNYSVALEAAEYEMLPSKKVHRAICHNLPKLELY